jgi:sigma-B regulation protein RsbU (phosphoserine phosphatase)
MPLGMLPEAAFEVREHQLRPGDRIVAFSDGFSEAQNTEGELFDFRRVIAAHAGAPGPALHQALMDEFEQFSQGNAQADDVTVMVIEYAGQ